MKTNESLISHYIEWVVELTKKSPTGNIDSKSLLKLIEECKAGKITLHDK